jgi:hypothetical protein
MRSLNSWEQEYNQVGRIGRFKEKHLLSEFANPLSCGHPNL